MSYVNNFLLNIQIVLRYETKLIRFFYIDLKFTSYLMYVGCAELWKKPYIPGLNSLL